jgi:ABC-type multidrug transport system ATPase subunit
MSEDVRPLLEVQGLDKAYRSGWGLHDVSFSLPAGVIAALGGPNGSGKSTLLKCLAGLSRFDGTARIDGVPVDGSAKWREMVGYLPQWVSLPDDASIGEVIDLFADLRGVGRETVSLPPAFVRPDGDLIGELSGGQRHRVALAVALLGNPKLLLLDEPVASLDEEGRTEFWSLLRLLRDRDGVTSIVSSPSPSELRGVADRALYMDDGRLVLEEELGPISDTSSGDPDDLLEARS